MSRDFWFGMFAVPAAAVALAILAGVVLAFVWYSERFSLGDWKLWPKKVDSYNRYRLPAVVACAKWARYFWIPGWHVVICRTRLAGPVPDRLHNRVERAVEDAIRGFDAEREQ